MVSIKIKKAMVKDAGHISVMEIVTQEFPLLIDDIKPYAAEEGKVKMALIATINNKEVGYVLLLFDMAKRILYIDGIGVKPPYRLKAVSRRLLNEIVELSVKRDMVKIQMLVPSYTVDDMNDPWNIAGWLLKTDFKAAGIIADGCRRYNRDYDYYVFEKG